jgi:poly-gamma-glutamate capsule biosynthesis protein CapA/YwtB (metallophosphatase superfamily)
MSSDANDESIQQRANAAPGENLGGTRLTRRELLVTAAAVTAAAAVAGCAPSSPAKQFNLTRPATVTFDASVPAALRSDMLKRLAGVAGIPSAVAAQAGQAADLVIGYGPAPAGYNVTAIGASPLTLYTHARVPVDEVTRDQAVKLLGGQITNWSDAGAPYSLSVRIYGVKGQALPNGISLAGSASQANSVDDLLAALRGQPGSIGVAPAEATDWRLRNLGVDGVYPAQGRGDASKGGLGSLTLQLGVAQSLHSQGLDAKAVANALKPALFAGAPIIDMLAVGDIMLGRRVNDEVVARNDYTYPYQAIHDHLQSSDVRIANLECTITDAVTPPLSHWIDSSGNYNETFAFFTAGKAVEGLKYAGFNLITVANNHAGDLSVGADKAHSALLNCRKILQDNNIGVCGGGDSVEEAHQAAVTTVKGTRIALLGYHDRGEVSPNGPIAGEATNGVTYSWGLARADASTVAADITAARAKADLVNPYFHWGHEYVGTELVAGMTPNARQQSFARAAIDGGADMVLGNHPHVTQGIEVYKGKLIVYSMGNFVFDQTYRPNREALMVHLYWRGTSLVSVGYVPVVYNITSPGLYQPRAMSQAEATSVFSRLWVGADQLAAGKYGPEN